MAVGSQPTKNLLDGRLNQIAFTLRTAMEQITRLQDGIGAWTDAQVAALGYDLNTEVATGTGIIRPVVTDMVQLKNIFYGTATLGAVKDFNASFKRVTWIE